jgi:hypothetical protein
MSDREQLRNALRNVLAQAPNDEHGKRLIVVKTSSITSQKMPVMFPEAFDMAERLLNERDEIETPDQSGSMRY